MLLQPPHKIELSYYPLVTVAVCTRDRAISLERCLKSLLDLKYPNYEILVIDNAPTSPQTAEVVRHLSLQNPLAGNGKSPHPIIRWVVEPRPGLDWARNRAIKEAHGEIIAYTDDDVVADPYWLLTLVQTFQVYQADCVTGNVLPYEMETREQFLFERYGGFSRSFSRHIFNKTTKFGMSYPIAAHHFGTGANMAFRRTVFDAIGMFDEALDVGTPSNGAGDLEIYFRVIKEGYTLIYEPNAIIWHIHRREYAALKRQIHNNGVSYYAYLTRTLIHYPDEWFKILRFAVWWWLYWDVRRLLLELWKPTNLPSELFLIETLAAFKGPFAYLKSRRLAHRIRQGQYQTVNSQWLEAENREQKVESREQ